MTPTDPGADLHLITGDFKQSCNYLDELGISSTIYGWGGKSNLEGTLEFAHDNTF
jgi:hypothetical protein